MTKGRAIRAHESLRHHAKEGFLTVTSPAGHAAANLSFAALQLNADLGFSRTVFGFGSGALASSSRFWLRPGSLLPEAVCTTESLGPVC